MSQPARVRRNESPRRTGSLTMQGRRRQDRELRRGDALWAGFGNLLAVLAFYFVVPLDADRPTTVLVVGALAALVAVGAVAGIVVREARSLATGSGGGLKGLHLVLTLEVVLVGFALVYFLLAVKAGEMTGIRTRLDALYFSAVTTTTVGFGDITPVGQLARAVVTAHLVFNVAFVAAITSLIRGHLQRTTDPR